MRSILKSTYNKIPHVLRRKRTIVFIIITLVIWNILTRGAANTSLIKTTQATEGSIESTVTASGKISSPEESILHFAVGGRLVWVGVKEGDTVKKGQAIASIDNERYQIELRQAQQDFTAAKAASEKVYDSLNGVSVENFDQKIARTAADATQNKAYDNVRRAQTDLLDTTIYSPVAGTVVDFPVHIGENMTAATVVGTVSNINLLEFKAQVDESDIGKIQEGEKADITLDAFADTPIPSRVARIGEKEVTTTTGATAFEVTFSLDRPLKYRLGMNGEATIIVDQKSDVIKIPTEAIQDDFVYVKKGNSYLKQKIKQGISSDTQVEIIDGVSVGDVIVTSGFEELPKKNLLQKLLRQ